MKNAEGYPDPTAGDAIRACGRMPTHIYNIYSVINNVARTSRAGNHRPT